MLVWGMADVWSAPHVSIPPHADMSQEAQSKLSGSSCSA